jgi:hypothetical protein
MRIGVMSSRHGGIELAISSFSTVHANLIIY